MKPELRIVTTLPLQEVWTLEGWSTRKRIRELTKEDIQALLRAGSVQFVIADVGLALQWVPLAECFRFWKTEVQPHLADPEAQVDLDDFPGGYFFWASEWKPPEGKPPIVALEKGH